MFTMACRLYSRMAYPVDTVNLQLKAGALPPPLLIHRTKYYVWDEQKEYYVEAVAYRTDREVPPWVGYALIGFAVLFYIFIFRMLFP